MSIRNSGGGELVAECNGCGTEEYSGTLGFTDFVDWLKSQHWRIKKDGDEWEHYCSECS
jgi:hypothetical protein